MGRVVLSIDAELARGFHDLEQPPIDRIRNARRGWRRLVELLDAYEIPATWGVVGHLMLEACDGRHADHPAAREAWFERDPGGRAHDRSWWFGPDLVDRIRDATVDHEIGCYSFSYVRFDPVETPRDVVAAELEASLAVAAEYGINLDSFVFPRNVVGHTDLLAAYDFRCYRGCRPRQWYDDTPLYALGKLSSYVAGRSPPLVEPTVDEHGLVDLPASLCLFSFEGLARSIVEPIVGDPVVRRAKRGIDAAVASDGICHCWLHPNEVTTRRNLARLRRILAYVDERRRRTDLRVETMAEVARAVTDSQPTRASDLERTDCSQHRDRPARPVVRRVESR